MQKGERNSSRSLEPEEIGSGSNPGAELICFILQLIKAPGPPEGRLYGHESWPYIFLSNLPSL